MRTRIRKKRSSRINPVQSRENSPENVIAQLDQGASIPTRARESMERTFGRNLGRVRIHTDPSAGDLVRKLDARAFAVGNHIAFAPGAFQPGTVEGDDLLAHELVHVLQQGGDRGPVSSISRKSSSDVAGEAEADNLATAAVLSLHSGHAPALGKVRSVQTTPSDVRVARKKNVDRSKIDKVKAEIYCQLVLDKKIRLLQKVSKMQSNMFTALAGIRSALLRQGLWKNSRSLRARWERMIAITTIKSIPLSSMVPQTLCEKEFGGFLRRHGIVTSNFWVSHEKAKEINSDGGRLGHALGKLAPDWTNFIIVAGPIIDDKIRELESEEFRSESQQKELDDLKLTNWYIGETEKSLRPLLNYVAWLSRKFKERLNSSEFTKEERDAGRGDFQPRARKSRS